MNDKLYTQKKVADILGVKLVTVMKWVRAGKVNVVYLPMSSRPLITQEELKRLQTPTEEKPD
jgi:predicted site-specific integrase-resolvase